MLTIEQLINRVGMKTNHRILIYGDDLDGYDYEWYDERFGEWKSDVDFHSKRRFLSYEDAAEHFVNNFKDIIK